MQISSRFTIAVHILICIETYNILDDRLRQIQEAMEAQMRSVTIRDVMEDAERYLR